MHLYTSIVIPSAIHSSETWRRTTDKTNRMLIVFNRRCLRDIMGVSWKDHVTNEELLSSAGIGDPQDTVADRRRRFIGHVLHLPTSRPASLVIERQREEIEDGAGQSGHGRIHVEKICKKWVSVAVTLVKPGSIASDRAQWRQLVAQCSSRDRRT